jgi:hypothetical protein
MSASTKDRHVDFIKSFESIRGTKEYEEMDPEEREEMESLYEISKKRAKSIEYEKTKAKKEEKKVVEEEIEEIEEEEIESPLLKAVKKMPKAKKEESSIDTGSLIVLGALAAGAYYMFMPSSKPSDVKPEVVPESK